MAKEIFLIYEKNDEIPNILIGVVDKCGLNRFIENKRKFAEKSGYRFHHHIFEFKGRKFELKIMTDNIGIKTVTTYILDSYILNEGI